MNERREEEKESICVREKLREKDWYTLLLPASTKWSVDSLFLSVFFLVILLQDKQFFTNTYNYNNQE